MHISPLYLTTSPVTTRSIVSRNYLTANTSIQGVSQLLKQSDWAQIQDFK